MRKLILRSFQSPGDILMLTAAVRDLHLACPGQFQTDVRTSADAIWTNNPHITKLRDNEAGVEVLDMHYPLIHESNQRPYHFIHGYVQYLEQQLQVRIPLTRFHGDIHLASEEKQLPLNGQAPQIAESFWIIVGGGKYDFTAKWWSPDSYQKVVDHFRGKIQFVQCGEEGHWHPRLKNVVDLVGKTNLREFIRLMHHAAGVVCPVTFAMHLAAAVETKPGKPRRRPCVVVAGGREPPHWEAYPHHQFLSTVGALPCCADGGCWKSRCQLVGDGDAKDRNDLCERPVQVSPELRIPKCMHMITPEDVIRRIEIYFEGGSLAGNAIGARSVSEDNAASIGARSVSEGRPADAPQSLAHAAGSERPNRQCASAPIHRKVLLKFPHGIADAHEFAAVLRELSHRPDWLIDVATLPESAAVLQPFCHQVRVLGRHQLDRYQYHEVHDISWERLDSPGEDGGSRAERCLKTICRLDPLAEPLALPVTPQPTQGTQALVDIFNSIGKPRLLVLGDIILDRYTWGDAERVSPEAPVLVLRADEEEVRLGGAASVAGLLRALDADVVLAGIVGDDGPGRTVRKLLDEAGIAHDGVLIDPTRPTTTKDRFMGRAAHRHAQQILRVDREQRQPIAGDLEKALCGRVLEHLPHVQVVLVSDYAKGACSPVVLGATIAAARKLHVPVLIDPARISDYARYHGATLLTPNRGEAALATGMKIDTPPDALKAGERLCSELRVPAVIVKLDADGMALSRRGLGGRHFPTRPRAVYDVTGAGDMVLAACGLCQAAGIDWEQSVQIANVAAGLEVEKLGVAAISREQIRAELHAAEPLTATSRSTGGKVLALPELLAAVETLRRQGKKIVFTNGCFDLLHAGHAACLREAALLGDVLVVGVNADAAVRRLKGPGRPVVPDADRAALLAALAAVDFVTIFDDDTPHDLLRRLRPDVLVKGGTYAPSQVVGREIVEGYGGQVRVTGRLDGRSTTHILETISQQES